MAKIYYKKWELKNNTIRAYGGKKKEFVHNCPIRDFIKIVKTIVEICLKEKTVSRLDILNKFENTKLNGNRIFKKKSHGYKVKIVFDVLLIEKLIMYKGIKKDYENRRGRNPYGYVLCKNKNEIEKWLNNLK